jgi:allophanate hydrolase subunit 2
MIGEEQNEHDSDRFRLQSDSDRCGAVLEESTNELRTSVEGTKPVMFGL